VTDLRTRSAASRKAQRSRKRRAAALDPAIFGPDGPHRGSARIDGIHSIRGILTRLGKAEAAE
jgi:hypothetical protein